MPQQAVAGYIAKHATKAAECVGTLDRRLDPADDRANLPLTPHAERLISECLTLGALDEFADLRLVQWAHMLGFRSHFSTKSRRYSTTLGTLRAARIAFIREQSPGWLPPDDQDPDLILAIGEWRFASQDPTRGETLVTAALTSC
ncbi:replication initiator [Actinomadura nitritigenes]